MPSLDRINEYVNTVCQQLRWKKAHIRVSEEMADHIIDGRDAYITQGMDEDAATEKAIYETGDPIDIGTQLDRVHRPKPQWVMLIATAALLAIGILIRLFIFGDDGKPTNVLFYTGVGVAGMIAAYFADFTIIGKYPKAVYFVIVALTAALAFLPQFWSRAAFYSQYIVLLFPLAYSAIIYATRNKKRLGILLCGVAIALPTIVTLFFPVMLGFFAPSTTGSMTGFLQSAFFGMALLGIAVYKKWFGTNRIHGFLSMLVPVAFLVIAFLVFMTPRDWWRLAAAFNPSIEPLAAGFKGSLTRGLLGGAAFFGEGIVPGEYSWFTTLHMAFDNDLVLTDLIVRYGWITFAVILCVLGFFIYKGFRLCAKQRSALGYYVSISIMTSFCMQAISYISYNLGFQFASPISLPLISFGNTATIINLVLIGFMLSVFRTGDVAVDKKIPLKLDKNP